MSALDKKSFYAGFTRCTLCAH